MTQQVSLSAKTRPPLKWAGGKRWLLEKISTLWDPYQRSGFRLVEPFCGGLAISFGLRPKRALLNDINFHLINFYNQLKCGLPVNLKMENDKGLYYRYRKRFNDLIREEKWMTQEGSLLFYYLNHTCYNGLCRFNQKGFFNVPLGGYKAVAYLKDFEIYHSIFTNWEFTSKDFEEIIIKRDDFVYADPPYDVEFRRYSSRVFEWSDQIRLAKWAQKLEGPVVISNQATSRIVRLYKSYNFQLVFVEGPRMISCNGNRNREKEVLAVKRLKNTPG